MLNTADILIDGQPIVCIFTINPCLFPFFGVGSITELIPAWLYKSIKCICLSNRCFAALRTRAMLPGRVTLQRIPFTGDLHIFRQRNRQIFYLFRHQSATVAVDKWYRRTPVALTTYTPITQFIIGCPFADTSLLEKVNNRLFGISTVSTIKTVTL